MKAAVPFISIESDAVTLTDTAADRRQPLWGAYPFDKIWRGL